MGKLSKRKKSLISFLESWCVAISSNAFIASAVQMTTINTLTIFQWKIWGALVAIGAIGFFVSVVLRLYLLTFE